MVSYYIMLDDEHYYGGWVDGEFISSTNEEDCFLFIDKKEAQKALEDVKVNYPNAELYISLEV